MKSFWFNLGLHNARSMDRSAWLSINEYHLNRIYGRSFKDMSEEDKKAYDRGWSYHTNNDDDFWSL